MTAPRGNKYNLGNKWTVEQKERQSLLKKGKPNGRIGTKQSEETKNKISESNKGRTCWIKNKKHSPESIEKMKKRKGVEKGRVFKGDNVGIHYWVERELGKPMICEICKTTERKVYDWSNKDHKYRKVVEDWQRLCRKCHKKYDEENNNKKILRKYKYHNIEDLNNYYSN